MELLGIKIEPAIKISELASAAVGIIGLISLIYTLIQIRQTKRTRQTTILLSLQQRFRSIQGFEDFLYGLDYSSKPYSWKFDRARFGEPNNRDERILDAILYELAFVGSLVSSDLRIKHILVEKLDCDRTPKSSSPALS
jgi:hypothetical protein